MADKARTVWKWLRVLAGGVLFIAGLLAIPFAVVQFVDQRVERQLAEESYMERLAAKLRPSLILDASGSVLSDRGALDLVSPPKVERIQEVGDEALRVTVTPHEFLESPPVLESLDHQAVITSERGEGITWVYTIRWKQTLEFANSPKQEELARFRLEVVY